MTRGEKEEECERDVGKGKVRWSEGRNVRGSKNKRDMECGGEGRREEKKRRRKRSTKEYKGEANSNRPHGPN